MWLFDDLLKKPTTNTNPTSGTGDDSSSGSTGGNPPVSDPLAAVTPAPIPTIQKSEEISIVTEAPAETAAAMPPPVTVTAVEDSSSIIIGSTPAPSATVATAAPTIVTTPETSVFSNIEVTPTIIATSPTHDIHDIGIISAPVEPVIVSIEEKSTESGSIMDLIGWPGEPAIVEAPSGEESITDMIAEVSSTETPTVMMSEPIVPVVEAVEVEPIVDEVAPVTPELESSVVPEPELTPVVETIVDSSIIGSITESEPTVEAVETYEHPTEFIEASIARIDAMIARIDAIHNSKLEEALGYKAEKEKYTALEEQAYADAEKYVGEKDHALAMRTYFVDQGKAGGLTTPEPIASVETTLTGLAVQNAVSETVKSEKKTKAKKESKEEFGILGL